MGLGDKGSYGRRGQSCHTNGIFGDFHIFLSWWEHSAPNPVCEDQLLWEDNGSSRSRAQPVHQSICTRAMPSSFLGRDHVAATCLGGKLLGMRLLLHLHLVSP